MKKLSRVSFLLFINWDNILLFELDKTYECKYVYCCISCPSWFCFLCMNIHAAFDRRTCIIYLSARRNWYDVKPLTVIIVTKFMQWYANYPNDSHVYFFSCIRVDERTLIYPIFDRLYEKVYLAYLIITALIQRSIVLQNFLYNSVIINRRC